MIRFRKPLDERIRDFCNDATKRRAMQAMMGSDVMKEAIGLVGELLAPKGLIGASLGEERSIESRASAYDKSAGGALFAQHLFELCDPALEAGAVQQRPNLPPLLGPNDPIPDSPQAGTPQPTRPKRSTRK